MAGIYKKHINSGLLFILASILSIISFPINLLVLANIIKPHNIKALWYAGWVILLSGLVLVGLAYNHIYIRKTNVLIKSGIYRFIRHPLYLGWSLAVFITNIFINPHWVFIITGITGAVFLYLIAVKEEQDNIKKFGDEYKEYLESVPRMNIFLGFIKAANNKSKKIHK
ncbi:MAG: isoprenylcysteine carboxylmethyltransferase family protein [Actinobacteria bacterium]|nr:isoprenylcysteine carboxylmethyltransferase family protein [Actinomycetota bacterium]